MLSDTQRAELLEQVTRDLTSAFAALRELRQDKDNLPDPDDLHETYEKATEQAISLIVDSGAQEDSQDDFGTPVGGLLQATLMMAVMLKSDILDHLDI